MIFNIGIADYVFRVNSLYDAIYDFCKDYLTDSEEEYSITVSQKDIENEREIFSKENKTYGRITEAEFEITVVYRKICDYLAEKHLILFHSSAVCVDGYAYLFTGPSGTGKSTHAKLWKEYLGEKVVYINDDKPLIKLSDKGATVYGTPWNGKYRLGNNISAPLKAVFFLEQSKNNEISKIDKSRVIPKLLNQTYRPNSFDSYLFVLQSVSQLGKSAEFFLLKCNMDIEAAQTAYKTINENN